MSRFSDTEPLQQWWYDGSVQKLKYCVNHMKYCVNHHIAPSALVVP